MATPYFQLRFEDVPSTQDVASEHFDDLPILVISPTQSAGRGRGGSDWLNADRALAVSLAFRHEPEDRRPFSLIAGLAAIEATSATGLKWPNDVMVGDEKVGGILTERRDDLTVVGLGLNLWWPEAPPGVAALYRDDPGSEAHAELGALWGAEMMQLIDGDPGWPVERYRSLCTTLGNPITWEPEGRGMAADIDESGALVVDVDGTTETIISGEVRHVRQDVEPEK